MSDETFTSQICPYCHNPKSQPMTNRECPSYNHPDPHEDVKEQIRKCNERTPHTMNDPFSFPQFFRRIVERNGKKYLQECSFDELYMSQPIFNTTGINPDVYVTVISEQEFEDLPKVGGLHEKLHIRDDVANTLVKLAHHEKYTISQVLYRMDLLKESDRELLHEIYKIIFDKRETQHCDLKSQLLSPKGDSL